MAQNFIGCDRDQVLLLPPDLREWLPAGHFARFVIGIVSELDLSAVYGYYRRDGHGRPAHDPAMMVALVLYAYAIGVTTSRAIERRCVDDVAFRVISANQRPDHATVARFLVRHRDALSGLFGQVLALCQRAGMVRVGTVAVDSTKMAANASAGQSRTLAGLEAEARRIIDEAIEADRREDELYGDKRGDELPEDLADPRTRQQRIRELLEQARQELADAEKARAEKAAEHAGHVAQTGRRKPGRPLKAGVKVNRGQGALLTKKYNLTDPDSAIVRHRGMLMQGYGIQTAVNDHQVILAARVGNGTDQGQLKGTLEAAQDTLARLGIDALVPEVLADAGYFDSGQIREIQKAGTRVLVPPRRTDKTTVAIEQRAELSTAEGEQIYKRRQQLIEPVFAHWKHIRGITRVWRRGKQAVQAEIDLVATTHNLLKLYRAPQPA